MRGSTVKAPRLTCARCSTRLANPATRIFSRSTKLHYCGDIDKCGLRASRKLRLRKVPA